MIETPWDICGGDTLGIPRINDPDNPFYGRTPIPPVMDTQLDQILIQDILMPFRSRILHKFEGLISPAKPEAWWEVYLSTFILLNHIERLARHSVLQARRQNLPVSLATSPPNVPVHSHAHILW